MSETVTLVASDLDGTLLNSQKKVTPETREALKQLKITESYSGSHREDLSNRGSFS